jgi:hypothetical protein
MPFQVASAQSANANIGTYNDVGLNQVNISVQSPAHVQHHPHHFVSDLPGGQTSVRTCTITTSQTSHSKYCAQNSGDAQPSLSNTGPNELRIINYSTIIIQFLETPRDNNAMGTSKAFRVNRRQKLADDQTQEKLAKLGTVNLIVDETVVTSLKNKDLDEQLEIHRWILQAGRYH